MTAGRPRPPAASGAAASSGRFGPATSGEWGYSAVWGRMNEDRQGLMLPRQQLTNISSGGPLSIGYDWHDDGPDPREPEHHFGTVAFPNRAGRDPVYDPKPAYRAALALTSFLDGFRFSQRLATGAPEDHVLLFSKGDAVRLAVWTLSAEPRAVTIPASPGAFRVVGHLGDPLPGATPRLSLKNPLPRPLRLRTGPASVSTVEAGGVFSAPLPRPAEFQRDPDPAPLRVEWESVSSRPRSRSPGRAGGTWSSRWTGRRRATGAGPTLIYD